MKRRLDPHGSPPLRVSRCLLLLAAGMAAPGAAIAQDRASRTLESNRAGLRMLAEASAALEAAGTAPTDLRQLTVWTSGPNLQRFQSRTAEPPFDTLPTSERVAFHLPSGAVAHEFEARWPDFVRHVARAATAVGGVTRDFNAGEDRWSGDLTPARLAEVRRRVPHVAVLDALARPEAVRYLGEDAFGNQPAAAVAYVEPGGAIATLYLSLETGMPLGHEVLVDDLRFGDVPERLAYLDPQVEAGVLLPAVLATTRAGQEVSTLALDSASVDVEALRAALAPLASEAAAGHGVAPDDLLAGDGGRGGVTVEVAGVAGGLPSAVRVDELVPGVHLATAEAAPNYHVLIVDLGDGLLAVDAPVSPAITGAIAAAARGELGKPVTHAAITHHHGDHSGGLAAYARAGATILTTPGNVDFVTDVARAARGAADADVPIDEPSVRLIYGELALGESVRVILRDVGPHPHAEEHLVALIPEAGLVYQSDLVQFPADGGVEAARPQTAALVALIDGLDWTVERIVGAHGRAGTVADLRAAVAAAEERD